MIYLDDGDVVLHQGDCLEVMPELPEASVSAVVCDPPYELTPGGRTGATRGPLPDNPYGRSRAGAVSGGFMGKAWDGTGIAFDPATWELALRVLKPGGHLVAFGGTRTYHRLACAIEDAGFEIRDSLMWLFGSGFPKSHNLDGEWQGWGTALKPAYEPIVLARKPLGGTVAANVLEHGTGALNVDGCRVETDGRPAIQATGAGGTQNTYGGGNSINGSRSIGTTTQGRWPANLVLDEAAATRLDAEVGDRASGSRAEGVRSGMGFHGAKGDGGPAIEGSQGGPSRFFYTAKTSTSERDGTTHPTVKPIDLMRWLVRLVTPPGGVVLDPFLGSGTTLLACKAEGVACIGIEREPEYVEQAIERYRRRWDPQAAAQVDRDPDSQPSLFDEG